MRRNSTQSKISSKENAFKIKASHLSPAGPSMAFHAGCIIRDVLYIHGGVDKKQSRVPLSCLYAMDLAGDRIWKEVHVSDSPSLSHHASLVIDDRYMLLIGGWDGKIRTTAVSAFDTVDQRWLHPPVSGFPEGGGLSSHTVTQLCNGDIFVCGRDGSTRMHRRHGNAYILRGSIETGFTYTDSTRHVESRSGHTAHGIRSSLYIIGGRSDKTIEVQPGIKCNSCLSEFVSKLSQLLSLSKPMSKPPCGRKMHASKCCENGIFIHGGETFDGKSREPVSEMFFLSLKPEASWHKLGDSGFGRAGHVCCSYNDKLLIHGGEGAKGLIHSDSIFFEIES